MWMCDRCKAIFDEPDILHNGGGDWGEHWSVCPERGHDSIAEWGICVECGAPVPDESGECICDNCVARACTVEDALVYGASRKEDVRINGFLKYYYTQDEINAILMERFRADRPGLFQGFRRDGMAELYVREDEGDYRDFLTRRAKLNAAEAV